MPSHKNNYFNSWRHQNPNYWNYIQLRWYHKEKKGYLLGQKKLTPEEYALYTAYEDKKRAREIMRIVTKIDREDKMWGAQTI